MDGWTERTMTFRYQLGEVVFFSQRVKVAVLDRSFLELGSHPEALAPPVAGFGRHVQCFVVLSHPIASALPPLALAQGMLRFVPIQYQRCYVRIDGRYEDYLAKFSGKTRATLRRKLKKYAERNRGAIRLDEFRTPAELAAFHALARPLAERTYQERLLAKGLPDDERFVREMAELAAQGRARGYLLYDGETPIAYLYAVIKDGAMDYDFTGYDPEYRQHSPGTVLLLTLLERLFADKSVAVFDFGEGEGEHKLLLATDSVRCADIYFFPRRSASLLLGGSQIALHGLSRSIVKGLDALGVKERVKRLLRGAGARNASNGEPET
jgi:CelD/BcsL family acetyltransferase involved in cellulose biosynthesis